jgi:hypothetical protein
MREVLGRFERAGFTLNPDKIILNTSEIQYLGHLISSRGVKVLPERVEAIKRYPGPATLRDLRRFLGMILC